VANSPSFEDKAVLEFFERSGRNLLARRPRGVGHHGRVVRRRHRPPAGQRLFTSKIGPRDAHQTLAFLNDPSSHAVFFEFIKSIVEAGGSGDVIACLGAVPAIASAIVAAALADLVWDLR